MKINLDIDCTPQEARAFLGLPDVSTMQEGLLAEVEERMRAGLAAMEPESLLKAWLQGGLPAGMQGFGEGFEQLQKMMQAQMGGAAGQAREQGKQKE